MTKNRRLTIRDLADTTIGISRGSLNTVSKDILGKHLEEEEGFEGNSRNRI